jgi:hypothetical protein
MAAASSASCCKRVMTKTAETLQWIPLVVAQVTVIPARADIKYVVVSKWFYWIFKNLLESQPMATKSWN